MENSLPKNIPIIFEKGKDPGEGYLRVVANLAKMEEIQSNPSRQISFKELHEVMFTFGRSTFLEEYNEPKFFNGEEIEERQFRIIGLNSSGNPIVVVFTARDGGMAKRVITAWRPSQDSVEVKKLLSDCPILKDKTQVYFESQN